MRIMGLDFGSRTTGVAVSDPLGITAQGVETMSARMRISYARPVPESRN